MPWRQGGRTLVRLRFSVPDTTAALREKERGSAWAGYHRIDQLAREELHMQSPNQGSLVLMRRSPRVVQTATVPGEQQ